MILTFEELRKVKDSLPHGSIEKIAKEVGVEAQTVRNYFGSDHFSHGGYVGAHYETGIHGGYVKLDDDAIFLAALRYTNRN
jgi:hypothetical protein